MGSDNSSAFKDALLSKNYVLTPTGEEDARIGRRGPRASVIIIMFLSWWQHVYISLSLSASYYTRAHSHSLTTAHTLARARLHFAWTLFFFFIFSYVVLICCFSCIRETKLIVVWAFCKHDFRWSRLMLSGIMIATCLYFDIQSHS